MGEEQRDFFISYTSADRAWAEWIAWKLELGGYTTLIQAWDFRPGMNFVTAMQKGATESSRTLIVLSAQFFKSGFTEAEWTAAFATDPAGELGLLIPVRVADCKPPGLLRARVYIDLVGLTDEAARQALLDGVTQGRAKPTRAPAFPGSARPPPVFPPAVPRTIQPISIPIEPVKIFYSYARKDKTLREELGKHLSSFRFRGICQDWHDGDIGAGDEWEEEINEKLRSADFILLLISADFLSSLYIQTVELEEAMQRHQAKEARVIPIMLRPCDFTGAVFSKLQGLPTEMKAVTMWQNQDEAWTDVVKGLALQFETFRKERVAPSNPSVVPPTAAETQPAAPRVDGLNEAQEKNRELAETSTKAFQGLSELMANTKIKAFVAEQQGQLVSADEALKVLVDYKNVHDILHDLQFKCYNYIFQEGRKLEDQIDWTLLVQPAKDLKAITRSLEEVAEQKSMADEDFSWLDQLRVARDRLSVACDELSLIPLNKAGKLIKTILEMRPTIFDTKLCAAARTLPLDDLREALCAIRDKLNAGSLKSDAGTSFSAGVDVLPELSANLQALTTEHARWQVIATKLWSIDALIARDLTVLRNGWPQVLERLARICGGNSAPWALSILEEAKKLDDLLNVPPPGSAKELQRWQVKVRQSYTSCSNDGGTRFYQVDLSLKRLCDRLRELQEALVNILQILLL